MKKINWLSAFFASLGFIMIIGLCRNFVGLINLPEGQVVLMTFALVLSIIMVGWNGLRKR